MGSVTLDTWLRFYDRVVERGSDWPRNLWLAAVEDGLRAALPAQSRLLVQYRQDVAELRELERTGPRSSRDATRMAQLEAEIMSLIGIADQAIREAGADVDEAREPAPPVRPRVGFWLGALILFVIMLCGVLLGATYYHQLRMSERMKLDLTTLHQRLLEQQADQRGALEVRIRSADRAQTNLGALQAELRANVDEFQQADQRFVALDHHSRRGHRHRAPAALEQSLAQAKPPDAGSEPALGRVRSGAQQVIEIDRRITQ